MSQAGQPTAKHLREQRLAKALRDNLKRRKAQARERASDGRSDDHSEAEAPKDGGNG